MSRPTIQCPHCGRELFNLRYPHCSWCGMELTEDQFQRVALPAGSSPMPSQTPLPLLPPMVGMPWGTRRWQPFDDNPFRLIKRSISPWERNLRIVAAALTVCLLLAHLAHVGWEMWLLHRFMPNLHWTVGMKPTAMKS